MIFPLAGITTGCKVGVIDPFVLGSLDEDWVVETVEESVSSSKYFCQCKGTELGVDLYCSKSSSTSAEFGPNKASNDFKGVNLSKFKSI